MLSRLSCSALPVATAAFLLAGCGAQSQRAVPQAQVIHNNHARSWMSPRAKAGNLLYVSSGGSGGGDVLVYSFRSAKLVGTLTGFDLPLGLCVDKAQNVYVVNDGAGNILEYPHGGTSKIKTLSDPYGQPQACSVDPMTGNLAVADSSQGVLVYRNASGTPTDYTNSAFENYFSVGYDDRGNLFVDGIDDVNYSETPEFAELPKGGNALAGLVLNQQMNAPGSLQWDGKYLAILDDGTSPQEIDQFSISGSSGTLSGTTALKGSYYINQFWVPKFGKGKIDPQGRVVVAADTNAGDVSYWKYPNGGTATKTLNGTYEPTGVTVSKGKQ